MHGRVGGVTASGWAFSAHSRRGSASALTMLALPAAPHNGRMVIQIVLNSFILIDLRRGRGSSVADEAAEPHVAFVHLN